MRLPNIQLTNKEKKAERDSYMITPQQSRRLAAKCGQKHDRKQNTRASKKLFHYREKFWKLSPVGYFIKDHDTHFVFDPNASASTPARQERRREKYKRANKKVTEALRQLINNKQQQATTST
jgi:hypothetical protein